jgi:glycosyltransferase involved in cell wall biosynthesis
VSNHSLPESADSTAPVVIIPAFQPTQRLVGIVEQLLTDPEQIVIVVDDGSSPAHEQVFAALAGRPRLHLLRHAVNVGKGQALKTAFNYFLVSLPRNHVGVVTADADGQHLVDDVRNVAATLSGHPGELVLGSRCLRGTVPWRSAIGNSFMKHVFTGLLGRKLEDTQTGLRGIPRAFLSDLLPISASGYEFELEMLIKAVKQQLPIREVRIETVYEGDNDSSHFNPIRDSLRIYFVLIRRWLQG